MMVMCLVVLMVLASDVCGQCTSSVCEDCEIPPCVEQLLNQHAQQLKQLKDDNVRLQVGIQRSQHMIDMGG